VTAVDHIAQADSDTQGPPPAGGEDDTPPVTGDIADVRAVALLTAQKRDLEAQLRIVEQGLASATAKALEFFRQEGTQSVTVEGYTVFLKRELWAKIIDPALAMAALDKVGWGEYVAPKTSSQSLSARLRELDKDGVPLPSEFEGAIAVSEVYKINARKK